MAVPCPEMSFRHSRFPLGGRNLRLRRATSAPKLGGDATGRFRFESKLSHFIHHDIEKVSHLAGTSPEMVCRYLADRNEVSRQAESRYAHNLISAIVGVVFGRWHLSCLNRRTIPPHFENAFSELPELSPAHTRSPEAKSICSVCPWESRPISVDDPGHSEDILSLLRAIFGLLWGTESDANLPAEVGQLLDPAVASEIPLREWFRAEFFGNHIKRYSKSRRKAPDLLGTGDAVRQLRGVALLPPLHEGHVLQGAERLREAEGRARAAEAGSAAG